MSRKLDLYDKWTNAQPKNLPKNVKKTNTLETYSHTEKR